MEDYLWYWLGAEEFMARTHCGPGWSPTLVTWQVTANVCTWVAYIVISVSFWRFRRHLNLPPAHFGLVCAFIYACAWTHAFDALMFTYPVYRLDALWRTVTAFISVLTAVSLPAVGREIVSRQTTARQDVEFAARAVLTRVEVAYDQAQAAPDNALAILRTLRDDLRGTHRV